MKKAVIVLVVTVMSIGGFVSCVYLFPEQVFRAACYVEQTSAGLEVKSARVGSLTYKYLDGGSGEPLVLLHGFGASKEYWTRVSKYLTPHFRVIALDITGFGESTKRYTLNYTVSAQVERLHSFLETIGVSACHMGGNSLGGSIAGVYSITYPDRIKSLWLIAPGGVSSPVISEYEIVMKQGKNPLIIHDFADYNVLMDFAFEKRPWLPSPFMQMLADKAARDIGIHMKIFNDMYSETLPLDKMLAGVTVPTLVAWGDSDRILDVSGAEVLCTQMAKATCSIIPETGHIPMVERPKETAQRFLMFHNL